MQNAMFRFQNPEILYLLFLLVPLWAVFFYFLRKKKKNFALLGEKDLIEALTPQFSWGKIYLKFAIYSLVYALLIICLANPQMGTSLKKAQRKGIDIMIALDVSNSMNCEDIQPSRLSRAKASISRLLDKLEGDRVGLVVFAGNAFMQLPLTNDYGASKLFVNSVSSQDVSEQGTVIGKAIELCMQGFEPSENTSHSRAIIVISDGEDHEDNAIEQAQKANKMGVLVNTIGMGLPQGAPIPVYMNGRIVDYKRNRTGEVVLSKINEDMLIEIARAGGGSYVSANNISAGVEEIYNKLSGLDKALLEEKTISDYESRFQYPLSAAILLLILEIFIFDKRHPLFNRENIFGGKGSTSGSSGGSDNKSTGGSTTKKLAALSLLFVFSLPLSLEAQTVEIHQANKQYKDKNYSNADELYRTVLGMDSNSLRANYNLGNTQYRLQEYEKAIEQYNKVLSSQDASKKEKAMAAHNIGNSHMQLASQNVGNPQAQMEYYQKAVDSYKQSLKNSPSNKETQYNLAYAQKLLKQQQEQQQEQQPNQNQQDNQNQEDKNQDQQQQQQNQGQDNKDQKDQENQQQQQQNQDQGEEQKQQQQQNPSKEDQKKQDAERMLKAVENQEKNTLDKLKKQLQPAQKRRQEKDW